MDTPPTTPATIATVKKLSDPLPEATGVVDEVEDDKKGLLVDIIRKKFYFGNERSVRVFRDDHNDGQCNL